jgi:hypothetical protein
LKSSTELKESWTRRRGVCTGWTSLKEQLWTARESMSYMEKVFRISRENPEENFPRKLGGKGPRSRMLRLDLSKNSTLFFLTILQVPQRS